jgi:hypothetical protein
MSYAQQRQFLYTQRRLMAQFNRPETVQIINAILASIEKAERFTRKR